MATKYGYNIYHLRRIGELDGENVFEYEKRIEDNWANIDISHQNLRKLSEKYPDADFLRALYAERNYNFFPKYNGTKRESYETQLKYLMGCITVFEDYINSHNIDCVISDLATGIPDVFKYICESNNIKYITIRTSKLNKGLIFCDGISEEPIGLLDKYSEFRNNGVPDDLHQKSEKHINDIRKKIISPSYMEVTKNSFKLLSAEKFLSLVKKLVFHKKRITTVSMNKHPILTTVLWNFNRLKNIWITKLNKKKWFLEKNSSEDKYFIFTLQYEPENSTAIRSYPFSNQLCVIENIAKALPLGVYLYVKEHKGNQGYRKSNDYKELSYFPNVKILPRESSVTELLKNCIGVITLSSRMGWEGLILNKSVITLGRPFYYAHEKVKKPKSWKELKNYILDSISEYENKFNDEDNGSVIAFAAAYLSLSYNANYIFKSEGVFDDENIGKISSAIREQMK